MKVKKRLFVGLLVLCLTVSMAIVSAAAEYEVKYFEGEGGTVAFRMRGVEDDLDGDYQAWDVKLEYQKNVYGHLTFMTELGLHSMYFEFAGEKGLYYLTDYNGTDYSYLGNHALPFYYNGSDDYIVLSKSSFGEGGSQWFYISFAPMRLQEVFPDKSISTNIQGSGYSVTGEYLIELEGTVNGLFADGVTSLTGQEIANQEIAIRSYNVYQDEERIMNSSTINAITVTVENQRIVLVKINGRAMTANGNFDTYVITVY